MKINFIYKTKKTLEIPIQSIKSKFYFANGLPAKNILYQASYFFITYVVTSDFMLKIRNASLFISLFGYFLLKNTIFHSK